jgi:hypothetical protein
MTGVLALCLLNGDTFDLAWRTYHAAVLAAPTAVFFAPGTSSF